MRASRPNLGFVWAVMAGLVGCGGSTPPPSPPETATPLEPASAPLSQTSEPLPIDQKQEVPEEPDVPPAGAPLDRVMQAHFKTRC
jgi:hypothetical protein